MTNLVCAGETVYMAQPSIKYKTGQLTKQSLKTTKFGLTSTMYFLPVPGDIQHLVTEMENRSHILIIIKLFIVIVILWCALLYASAK